MENYPRELEGTDVWGLGKEISLDILEELKEVEEEFCTVQVQDSYKGIEFYCLTTMTNEELGNYLDNGGVWNYQSPSYWVDIIKRELDKMEYAETMLQQMQG